MNMLLNRMFRRPRREVAERPAPFDHPEIARMDRRLRDDLPSPVPPGEHPTR